jgi:esterase/lipase superfamily enzyme
MKFVSFLVTCAFLPIAACSTIKTGEFPKCETATIDPDGHPRVTVFFATNRPRTTDSATEPSFGFGRANNITYGTAVVGLPPDHDREFGSTSGLRILAVDFIDGDAAFANRLRAAATAQSGTFPGSQSFVFIHGYHEDFNRVAIRVAEVVHDGCFHVVPIMFAWPSRDFVLDYVSDLDSATFSRAALAHVLELVRDHSGFTVTHIMAHSMGNWITLEALKQVQPPMVESAQGPPPQKFGAAILASPDVDLDVFRQELPAVMNTAQSVVLLTSQHDYLLGLSRFLAHGSPRAGDATTEELVAHHVQAEANFAIIRMDGPEIGTCVGGSHRCAETNADILKQIRLVLEAAKDHVVTSERELNVAVHR